MIKRVRDLLGKSSRREVEGEPPAEAARGEQWMQSEEYFEQLDRAFADFDGTRAAAQSQPLEPAPDPASQTSVMTSGRLSPDVADAFEALLAAEERGEEFWPAALNLPDHVIDRIAVRVASRLHQGPLPDTVRTLVSEVAERLIREEIARIRARVEASRS